MHSNMDIFADAPYQDQPPTYCIVWTGPDGGEVLSSPSLPGMGADDLAASIIAAGVVPDGTPWRVEGPDYTLPPTISDQQKAFTAAIQQRLDAFAQERNYDNAHTCASYRGDPNPRFAAEGQYMFEMRSATWDKGNTILDDVLSGKRAMPTIAEVMAELPPLQWPDASTASTGEGGA